MQDKDFRAFIKNEISVEELYKRREAEKLKQAMCHDIQDNLHKPKPHPVTGHNQPDDIKEILFNQMKMDKERREKW